MHNHPPPACEKRERPPCCCKSHLQKADSLLQRTLTGRATLLFFAFSPATASMRVPSLRLPPIVIGFPARTQLWNSCLDSDVLGGRGRPLLLDPRQTVVDIHGCIAGSRLAPRSSLEKKPTEDCGQGAWERTARSIRHWLAWPLLLKRLLRRRRACCAASERIGRRRRSKS